MPKLGASIYTPHPDQQVSIDLVLHKVQVEEEKEVLFIGSTGSGKTVIASKIKRALHPAKMMFAVHRDALINQTKRTLISAGFPKGSIGIIAGKHKENRGATIQIISIQTATRRNIDWFDWKYLFFDEGHRTGFSTWGKRVAKENPHKQKIYLTATTWRLSKKECFEQLVPRRNWIFAPLPGELMKMGRLAPFKYYRATEIDTSDVPIIGGDFAKAELSLAASDDRVIEAGLNFWKKHYPGALTATFCVDTNHAYKVASMAEAHGRKVAIITSDTPIEDPSRADNPREGTRQYIYAQAKAGKIDMIISIDCLSEGFDLPEILCIWALFSTKSASLFYQRMGRGARTAPWIGKTFAVFLDQGANLFYEGDDGKRKGKFPLYEELTKEDFYDEANFEKGKRPPPRICIERNPYTWVIPEDNPKGCGAIVGSKTLVCPECGYLLPVRKGGKAIAAGEIVEIGHEKKTKKKKEKLSPEEEAAFTKKFQDFFCMVLDECILLKHSPGAAFIRCRNEFHRDAIEKDYYFRWARSRKRNVAAIWYWLKKVDDKRGLEGAFIAEWMPRFFPDINMSTVNAEYPPDERKALVREYALSGTVDNPNQYVLFK